MRGRATIGGRGRCFVLELPLDTPDGFGGVSRRYQPGPRIWGAIEFLAARESVKAGGLANTVTHRVTTRYRDGIGPDQRLALGPRRFRIRSADDPDGRRDRLVCLVEEIAA